jgi:hypothetical protein
LIYSTTSSALASGSGMVAVRQAPISRQRKQAAVRLAGEFDDGALEFCGIANTGRYWAGNTARDALAA